MKQIKLLSMHIQNFKGCKDRTIEFGEKQESPVRMPLERQQSLMRLRGCYLEKIALEVLILIFGRWMQTGRW